jgi:lysophospholipase L1-like esterase
MTLYSKPFMSRYIHIISFSLLLLLQTATIFAQEKQAPFWAEIQQFKKQDSIHLPVTAQVLFVGSSSFTKWTDVQSYFPSYPIINRGFGGSTLADVIRYADDIIFIYHPKQIVIYCGENDLAAADSVTAKTVFERFKQLFRMIKQKLPGVPVAYVAMKPSPSRWHLKEKMIEGNTLVKNFLHHQKKAAFINVWPAMLNVNGQPMKDIFQEDNLHMNARGYKIWQKIIKPYLVK